jgi:membrane protease YdiL (CAAX protease family)
MKMNDTSISAKAPKNVTAFFVLTFVLSLPFYILGTLLPGEMGTPISLLITFVPIISALILTFREDGSDGAKKLLKRSFDFKRITSKIWYAPILFLLPIVYIVVIWILGFIGDAPTESVFPLGMAPILLIMFFVMALGEEVGWTGYAYDPMEERWSAFRASLILGIIWAVWHIPLWLFVVKQTLLWTAGQMLVVIGLRVLLSWIYNNTGKSLFAAILFHAVSNVPPAATPVYASPLGPVLSAVLVIIIVLIITRVWDLKTLTELRK